MALTRESYLFPFQRSSQLLLVDVCRGDRQSSEDYYLYSTTATDIQVLRRMQNREPVGIPSPRFDPPQSCPDISTTPVWWLSISISTTSTIHSIVRIDVCSSNGERFPIPFSNDGNVFIFSGRRMSVMREAATTRQRAGEVSTAILCFFQLFLEQRHFFELLFLKASSGVLS